MTPFQFLKDVALCRDIVWKHLETLAALPPGVRIAVSANRLAPHRISTYALYRRVSDVGRALEGKSGALAHHDVNPHAYARSPR